MGNIADVSEVLLPLGLSSAVTEEERGIANEALIRAEGAIRRYLRYDPIQQSRTEYYPQQDFTRTATYRRWETTETVAFQRSVSGAVTDELQVQHIPIRETPAIDLRIDYDGRSGTQSGSFADETLKVEGTDFWPNYNLNDSGGNKLCGDGVIRSIGLWPTQAGSVRIIYTAGYTDEELHGQNAIVDARPILDAIIDEAVRGTKKAFVNMKQTVGWVAGPIVQERLGDYAYTLDSASTSRLFGSTTDLMNETKEKLTEFINYGYDLGG